MTIEKEISLINKIIAESIIHGGDDGGSYKSNRGGVVEAINEWLKEKGLESKYKVIDSYYTRKNLIYSYSTLEIVAADYEEDEEDWFK